jgi:membrane-associated phospholipid phosphatase
MLGDRLIASLLGIVGCVVLLAHRRFRLAIGLILALVSSMIFVQGMKVLAHPQPITSSIPSGDATMTATLYGALGWIAVRGAGANLGRVAAGACVTLIIAVAFSRIYLAALRPSDVAAGLLFGTGATAALALVFRGYEVPLQTLAMIRLGEVAGKQGTLRPACLVPRRQRAQWINRGNPPRIDFL